MTESWGDSPKRVWQMQQSFIDRLLKGAVIETSAKTAEMCKLAENAFRDVNIAFANELSKVCDTNDVNVWELISLGEQSSEG